jgi:hypothetical protein
VGEPESLADGLVSVAQEALEMLGVIWLILALITYLALTEASVKINFSDQ